MSIGSNCFSATRFRSHVNRLWYRKSVLRGTNSVSGKELGKQSNMMRATSAGRVLKSSRPAHALRVISLLLVLTCGAVVAQAFTAADADAIFDAHTKAFYRETNGLAWHGTPLCTPHHSPRNASHFWDFKRHRDCLNEGWSAKSSVLE